MRSGKRYLRAHPSWDSDAPTTCPRCLSAPETFEHAILHHSAKEPARSRHLQGVLGIGPDAPVWSSATLLGALGRFIKSTAPAFPPGMFLHPTSAAFSISSRSSNVVALVTLCRLRKARFKFLFFMLSAGLGRVSFILLV